MEGFPGVWAFAAIDLDTGAVMTIHEDLVIYPASSGKIVVAIAVLRAVQRGEVSLPSIEADFEEMMIRSDDAATDRLNGLVSQAETNAVLTDSGVSAASQFRDSWRRATFTAPDLARVWAALLRGELLDEERITYLLEISGRVELPENFATFPPRFERPGYQYGQKPGYYITGDRDVYAAGGFVRPLDGSGQGFVAAFISRLPSGVEGGREQRQAVFPILVRYLLGEE